MELNFEQYFSIPEFHSATSQLPFIAHCVNILHVNSRSLTNKYTLLDNLLTQLNHKVQILCVTETWHTANDYTDIPGYKFFYQNRNHKAGGGIAIYVKKSFSDFDLNYSFTNTDPNIEFLTIENNSCIISVCYRPPHGKTEPFFNFLHK